MNVGDKVKLIKNTIASCNSIGDIGVITDIHKEFGYYRVKVEGRSNDSNWSILEDLELYEEELTLEEKKAKLEKELEEVNKAIVVRDTPEYVKYADAVYKVKEWGSSSYCTLEYTSNLQPFKHLVTKATKEEYDAYQESLKPKFEVGRWYKYTTHEGTAICRVNEDLIYGTGLTIYNDWGAGIYLGEADEWELATEEEIKSALISEAKKRGFKYSTRFTGIRDVLANENIGKYMASVKYFKSEGKVGSEYKYNYSTDTLYSWGHGIHVIYEDGKWAEILPSTPDITIGEYQVQFLDNEIKVGCQLVSYKSIVDLYEALSKYNDNNSYTITHQVLNNDTKLMISLEQLKQITEYYKNK